MPLFQAFQDLKGFTSNMNPLNLFSAEQPAPPGTAGTPTSISTSNTPVPTPRTHGIEPGVGAVAGPGPSTAAALEKRTPRSSALGPSLGQPVSTSTQEGTTAKAPYPRPSLKHSNTSYQISSSDSSDSITGGRNNERKSSGASVSIADPEVTGEVRSRNTTRPRNRRPTSSGSGLTTGSGVNGSDAAEPGRKKKKTPLDTYIIVRPPPTSAKNPLNLQIQLVVKPNRRGRDRSASAFSLRSDSTALDNVSVSNSTPVSPSEPTIDIPVDSSSADEAQPVTAPPAINTVPQSPQSSSAESEIDAGLRRSTSLRSSISTSTNATGSSTASGKRIEPMFNLAVHNVMHPTVVTDAATDAKVAKFLKRSIDISGVGALEPAEVWLPASHANGLIRVHSHVASDDGHSPIGRRSRPVSVVSLSAAPLSPTLTRSDDTNSSGFRGSLELKGFKFEHLRIGHKAENHESNTRKFFGKVFKKKNASGELADSRGRKSSPSASFSSLETPAQAHLVSGADTLHPHAAVKQSAAQTQAVITEPHGVGPSHLGQPTFGTAPLVVARRSSGTLVTSEGAITGLSTPTDSLRLQDPASDSTEQFQSLPMLPSTRPVGYTWTVKKWAKKNTEGWAAHFVAAAAAGLEMVGAGVNGDSEDEVVFEWVKLRVPSTAAGASIMRRLSTTGAISTSRTRSKSRAASIGNSNMAANETSGQSTLPATLQLPRRSASPMGPSSRPPSRTPSANNSPRGSPKLDGRPEPIRRISASISPSRRTSSATTIDLGDSASLVGLGAGEVTAEEEEDSDPEDSETPWTCSVWVKKTGQRQLLGTLTPAPHHPKVIGILKIPMTLDSVSLTDIAEGNVAGKEHVAQKIKEGVALTEENLKDVVCVTAMWLVAREEFGGLGRKKSGRG
ncbi:hypothetical protein IAR55_005795 [Kwoniella newhampshirensis]|uniref:Uncharacterized protein n=1 Tax=Kwoniella newhampshirensis TaxID=1651941 RepID=A0AAW0YGE2_9TREE